MLDNITNAGTTGQEIPLNQRLGLLFKSAPSSSLPHEVQPPVSDLDEVTPDEARGTSRMHPSWAESSHRGSSSGELMPSVEQAGTSEPTSNGPTTTSLQSTKKRANMRFCLAVSRSGTKSYTPTPAFRSCRRSRKVSLRRHFARCPVDHLFEPPACGLGHRVVRRRRP